MTAPAPDRLQVLLDRACRGVASATEAEQLRAGVAQLQQQVAAVRALTADWRDNRGILGQILADQVDDTIGPSR